MNLILDFVERLIKDMSDISKNKRSVPVDMPCSRNARCPHCLVLLLGVVLALLALLCFLLGRMDLFSFMLSKAFIAMASRTISSLFIKIGIPVGLALAVGSFLLMAESSSCSMMEGTTSPSDSLRGHASSETDSEKEVFLTPPGSFSSSESDSSPSNEDLFTHCAKENLCPEVKALHSKALYDLFNREIGKRGIFDFKRNLPDEVIHSVLCLDSATTLEDLNRIRELLLKEKWPTRDSVDRTSVYSRIWDLRDDLKEPSGID